MNSNTNNYTSNYIIILIFGLSIAFGSSLKSVIDSFVFNTLEPMIILSLSSTNKNKSRITQLIHFISNILSFIIIILIILYTLKQY